MSTGAVRNTGYRQIDPNQWTGVNGRLWRWFIGRASQFARVFINLGAAFLQGLKCIGKAGVIVLSGMAYEFKGDFSTRALGIDGIALLALVKIAAKCAKKTLVAPSSKDDDFFDGVKETAEILSGDLQCYRDVCKASSRKIVFREEKYTLSEIFNIVLYNRHGE